MNKLNLTPLIKHFSKCNPTIAQNLTRLTKLAEHSILETNMEVQKAVDHLKSFYDQLGTQPRPVSPRWKDRETNLPPIPMFTLKTDTNPAQVKEALIKAKIEAVKAIQSSSEFSDAMQKTYIKQFASITDGAEFLKWYTTFTDRFRSDYESVVKEHQSKSAMDKWMEEFCKDADVMKAFKMLENPDYKKQLYQSYKNSGTTKARELALRLLWQDKEILKMKQKKNSSQMVYLQKVANTLIEIANELDVTDPDLAQSADDLLQEIVKEASSTCHLMDKEGHSCTDKCMKPSTEMVIPVQDIVDPQIDNIPEPMPEYDEITLEDLDARIGNMNWRIADRHRRESLERAKEHALKAKEYYDAYKRHEGKTHSIFDEAGEALRLKKFE